MENVNKYTEFARLHQHCSSTTRNQP